MKEPFLSIVLVTVLIMSCASAKTDASGFSDSGESEMRRANTDSNAPSVSGIEGNEWKLIEVYINGRNSRFSRDTLPEEPGNFFTLNFDAQNISGVGVPNRYSAPYTLGDNQTINITLIRSTMMASFFQPENLSEHDFFNYLQSAYSWKLANNTLELLSKTRDGSEVRLVFSL